MRRKRQSEWVFLSFALFVVVYIFPRPLLASTLLGRPKICILVIDGLGADKISQSLTPFIWELIHSPHEKATYYRHGQAVMPSLTNPNHVSIITGVYPQAHGITSNYYWDRLSSKPSQPLSHSEHIETETLFTLIENEDPQLFTAGFFGKGKLAELFKASRSGQKSPDYLWQYRQYLFFGLLKPSWDKKTMGKVIKTISEKDPDLTFVNLPEVDLTSHFYGPDSDKAREAIRTVDGQIRRLVNFLKDRNKWEKTVLIITADHGFCSVEPDPENDRPYTVINFGKELRKNGFNGITPISNGGIELLYMRDLNIKSDRLTPEQAEKLKAVRSLALQRPGIAEALYRLPNREDGNERFTLIRKYPQWRLNHMRTGEMFLIARPGYHFSDPFSKRRAALKGSHGGPGESMIPIIITGGYKQIKDHTVSTPGAASNPDLGATAAWLLALREPRGLNGSHISTELRGRILSEAFE